jgi:Sulfotransferase domain
LTTGSDVTPSAQSGLSLGSRSAASADRRPILVTGMPRSGTTWVGRMLTAGGAVGYINEPFNVESSAGTVRLPVDDWYAYVAPENEERVLSPLVDLLNFRYPLGRELMRSRSRTDVHHTIKMWLTSLRSRGRRPLIKEPHAVFSMGWFAERLRSEVVVTVRHPAAVVSSWKRLGWSFDFDHLLRQPALMRDWLEPFRAEMESARSNEDLVGRVALLWRIIYSVVRQCEQRSADVHVVRQEDLSRDPLGEYGRLYEALGLSFTSDAAAAVRASSSGDNPKETRVEHPHETRIDSRANLENWKHRLTEDECSRIRRLTEETAALYYPSIEWE